MNFRPLFALLLIVVACPAVSAELKTRSAPSLGTVRAPVASGKLRVLLVDDDWSPNNQMASKDQSHSDKVFRKLVTDAVGNDATAWDIETVKAHESGPGIERLRKYSLILWYTGASYGGNPDNTGVLSIEDEKTLRRYLEEVGGAVMLVSPGYMSNALGAYGTWEKSNWPFLSEVLGIEGGYGMAQRFVGGTVSAPDGRQFTVSKDTGVQPQFSAANPQTASVVFDTEVPGSSYTPAVFPVATSNAFGKGRVVYVGFTLENVVPAEITAVFNVLLDSTGLQRSPTVAASPTGVIAKQPDVSGPKTPVAAPVGPASVDVRGTPTTAEVTWTMPAAMNQTLGLPGVATRKPPNASTSQAPTVMVERLVPNAAAVQLTDVSMSEMKAHDSGPLTPGQLITYRVTVTYRSGATGSREAGFTPPLPKDPASLSGAVQSDGSVALTWPSVAGVTRYQISADKGLSAPVIVNAATQWRSARMPAIAQRWTVNSVYEPGGTLTAAAAWPYARTTVALPTPAKMFLTQPAGVGNYAESVAHARTKCSDAIMPGSLCKAAGFLGAATNWEGAWNDAGAGQSWPAARFDNHLDLGVARRVNCTPRKNGSTVCWANKHSTIGFPNDPHALTLIIMGDDNKAFFGNWEFDGDRLPDDKNVLTQGGWTRNWLDHEHAFAMVADLRTGAALDTQGVKQVPHACLSCHGGNYDPVSKMVIGASLLPVVPARVTWRSGSNRNDEEESIRRINYIVLQSNPAPAIVAQINTMYNGRPHSVDQPANDSAIPPGWQSQPDLYRKVILPYCSGCHFANRGALTFRDFANLQQNKTAIQNSVCRTFTMPHSEILFKKFWTEQDGDKLLPDVLMSALGMGSCR